MTLIETLRYKIRAGRIPPIFTRLDLIKESVLDENNNLSNYDKNNTGSKNKKVLISVKLGSETYY